MPVSPSLLMCLLTVLEESDVALALLTASVTLLLDVECPVTARAAKCLMISDFSEESINAQKSVDALLGFFC